MAYVNLEQYKLKLQHAFDPAELTVLLETIHELTSVDVRNPNTILFLDEIQEIPQAIATLRYFYENHPNIAVIAAGSVLEFLLSDKKFSFPVGRVEYIFLHPFSFVEYLLAAKRTDLCRAVETFTLENNSISENAHKDLLICFRRYLIIGGMPEAVLQAESTPNDPSGAARIHAQIIESYQDDIRKYPSTAKVRNIVREVFFRAPNVIGTKVKFSTLAPDQQAKDSRIALHLLLATGLLNGVHHTDAQGIPLGAQSSRDVLKLFHLDTGLLLAQCGIKTSDLSQLADDKLVNEGQIAEQFVAQELLATWAHPYERGALFYWLREKKARNAEVDFVLNIGKKIFPVEVKAGPVGSLKSVSEFIDTHPHTPFVVRFAASIPLKHRAEFTTASGTLHKRDFINLPIYLAGQLARILAEC